ncbi:MAG: hypothetical protein QOI21_982 [Actinomycetota bacterium]|nr:hypothetical protein [Actinomycetota bacterium]
MVPAQTSSDRVRRRHLLAEPVDPPISGSLPLLPPIAPDTRPWPVTDPAPIFLPSSGDLSAGGRLPVRRTKVTLTPPPAPIRLSEEEYEDEDVRVYLAPPLDGLGTFDLGSVPASVTPPKTWRKAAWFASLSSGGVVVALLFAGSFMVGSPNLDQASQAWTGYSGGQPLMNGEQETDSSSPQNGGAAVKPTGESRPGQPLSDINQPVNGVTHGTSGDSAPGGPGVPSEPSTTRSGATGTNAPAATPTPQKPPVTPAPMQSQPPRFLPQKNAQEMGEMSQAFLNTVPENPAAAAELTTGQLREQGPQALAQGYSDVAYFEVKNVYIDQDEGYTINTVEVTHDDGTKSVERRTLTFGDDNKIANDGR